ncbi:MAG: endolytic transglycosylase MltG [Gemmatimonadetes bacterium]|nr:endolytic transglycosylase MltG [Gemmatimonadota bacterium]
MTHAAGPPRGRIRKGRVLVAALILGLVVGGCSVGLTKLLRGPDLAEGPVTVVVKKGMGAGGVADALAQKGVIRNATVFKLQARIDDRASRIRPGTYEFELTVGEVKQGLLQLYLVQDAHAH